MSYKENQIVAYLISTTVAAGLYAAYVAQQYQQGGFEATTIASSWGTAVLIAIGA